MTRSRLARRTLATLAALLALTALLFAVPALAHHHGDHGFGDGHGFSSGPAGTIASFDEASGQLTIELADGGSISGLVTRFTWIDAGSGCDDHRVRGRHWGNWCRRHGDDDHGGWHHGNGDTGDLVAGATVDDAVLFLKDGKAFYAKVELGS